MPISRRVFVRSGVLGLVSYGLDPLFLDRAAYALGRPTAGPPDRPAAALSSASFSGAPWTG